MVQFDWLGFFLLEFKVINLNSKGAILGDFLYKLKLTLQEN